MGAAETITSAIDESISKTSNNVNSKNEKVKFSVKQPIKETKDLIAIHNTTEEKLTQRFRIRRLTHPSIAIMKAENTRGNNDFSNISSNII